LNRSQLAPCDISCSSIGQWSAKDSSICETVSTSYRATPIRRALQDKQDAQPVPFVNVSQTPTERAAAPAPYWTPLSCTAWGITCAKQEDTNIADSKPQPSTASAAKDDVSKSPTEREAVPDPYWTPLSCTAWGITCAKDNVSAEHEVKPVATTLLKLTAVPTSTADVNDGDADDAPTPTERDMTTGSGGLFARFIAGLRGLTLRNAAAEPYWTPLSCTAWGITCAKADDAANVAGAIPTTVN